MSLTQLLESFDKWANGFRERKGKILVNPETPIKDIRNFMKHAYLQGVEEGKKEGYKKGVRDAVERNFTPGGDNFK